MLPIDATILLSYIEKISREYNLNYDEVAAFCGLPVTPQIKNPATARLNLEHITIEGLDYLYDHTSQAVYKSKKGKGVKYIGQLSLDTYKIIV